MQKKTKKLFKKKSKPFKKKSKQFKKKSKQFKKQNKKRLTFKKKKIGGYFFKEDKPLVFDLPWKYPTTTWFAIAKKGSETRRDDEDGSFFPGMEKNIKINKNDCNCDDTNESSKDTDIKTESLDKSKFYNLVDFKFLKHPIHSWFVVSKDGAIQRRLNSDTSNKEGCNCEEEKEGDKPPPKKKISKKKPSK